MGRHWNASRSRSRSPQWARSAGLAAAAAAAPAPAAPAAPAAVAPAAPPTAAIAPAAPATPATPVAVAPAAPAADPVAARRAVGPNVEEDGSICTYTCLFDAGLAGHRDWEALSPEEVAWMLWPHDPAERTRDERGVYYGSTSFFALRVDEESRYTLWTPRVLMFAVFWRKLARPPRHKRRVKIVEGRARDARPACALVEGRTRELLDAGFALAHGRRLHSAYGGPFTDLWGPSAAEPELVAALQALRGATLPSGELLVDWEFRAGGLPAGLASTSDPVEAGGPRIARDGLPAAVVAGVEALARDHPVIAHHLRPGLRRHLELQAEAEAGRARCRCDAAPVRSAVRVAGVTLGAGQVFYRCSARTCSYVLPVVRADGSPVIAAGRQRPHDL